jgi:hypothetical protein
VIFFVIYVFLCFVTASVVQWSEFLATHPEIRVRFPAPPHFLRRVVGLQRGLLSLVSTTEELLERKNSGFGVESRGSGRRDPPRLPRGTLYPQKLALTSPTRGGRSVGIVLSRTQVTEFVLFCFVLSHCSTTATR